MANKLTITIDNVNTDDAYFVSEFLREKFIRERCKQKMTVSHDIQDNIIDIRIADNEPIVKHGQ